MSICETNDDDDDSDDDSQHDQMSAVELLIATNLLRH